ncbi:MAG: phosphoglycerate dehydrogenase [Methylobacter sp.]|uniref:phosphoglycerate dehydrogenase n=1 Tax=Methylobacter sp. TaxID=2051955 RepID=UPI00258AE052|nr:phosphoglycerate dehydrogenase [Methylobacter sp.]MCL7422895.1 phosphoglycerate dehydrogenase [Methylobacter sp.]
MKKILISDKLAEAGINYLHDQSDIQLHIETGLNEEGLCGIIGDYDALLIRSDTKVTKKVLQAGTRLKLIGRAGIGVDNVDLAAATEQGVIVMNTPDANATTTAELAIAHMMSLSRHLPAADRSIRSGKWERARLMGSEVAHKTLAIVGFGTIGRIVAQRGLGLKMRVIAHDPFVTPEIFESLGVESMELDELLIQADYLTLHCPLIEKTRGLIGRTQLTMMKKEAMLINCARGGLIDEDALYEALKTGQIAGAALDVYDHEPPANSPLLELDNIVFTPHLGASTTEAQVAVSVEIARQAVTFLKTGEAVNALNLPRLSAEELKKSREFMTLANILGKVLVNLATHPLEKIEVALFGRAAEVEARPVSVAALIGVLSEHVSTPVNRVNAENIARRQGISLIESKTEETQDYLSLIKVTGHYADQGITLAGALLGGRHPRLVSIDQFDLEVVPQGTLLITRHEDRPGVISAISAVLGDANINITRMEVSTADDQQQAMAVISVSEPLTDDLLQQLCGIGAVHKATQINL